MDMAAFDAPEGPVLESGTSRGNALNLHARLAFETTRPFRRAGRQDGCLWIGHNASVHQAGALPNSLSPKTATDGAAMDTVCIHRVVEHRSILLTIEKIQKKPSILEQMILGERSMARRLGVMDDAFRPAKSQGDGLSSTPEAEAVSLVLSQSRSSASVFSTGWMSLPGRSCLWSEV
jgi:hypothetical protein